MSKHSRTSYVPRFISKNIKLLPIILGAFLAGLATHLVLHPDYQPTSSAVIDAKNFSCRACFTPGQACLPLIIQEIDKAQLSVQMQAYSLTSKPIADALIRAKIRNVKVTVIADKSQRYEKYTQINALKQAGIAVYIDDKPAIAHNKIIIIDRETIIGGSYNFSNNAEKRNAENVTIIKNKEFAALYNENFKKRLSTSNAYETIKKPKAKRQARR
ncbi:MAG: phospholipase D family protein [Pseudomonadota bacterium]|jgi:phospholipase D|nr:phospholipase D family protein [Alphaproteobacteria bacterium]